MCNNYNKSQRPCLYLLMGFNIYLGQLVKVEGTTSISIILLIDVDMERFPPYMYVQTPWAEHTKTTTREPPSLGIQGSQNWYFFLLSLMLSSTSQPSWSPRLSYVELAPSSLPHPSRFARVAIIHESPLIFIGVRVMQPWMRRHDIVVDCTAATGRAQPSAWPRQLQETKTQSSSRVGTHTSALNPNKSGLAKAN